MVILDTDLIDFPGFVVISKTSWSQPQVPILHVPIAKNGILNACMSPLPFTQWGLSLSDVEMNLQTSRQLSYFVGGEGFSKSSEYNITYKFLAPDKRIVIRALYGKTSDAQGGNPTSPPTTRLPSTIPNLRPEFFASSFWFWFCMQRRLHI